MTERRVTTTSVRAFFRCIPKFSESPVGVDKIDYEESFYLFKDKGQTKFQYTVTYPYNFRLVNMEQLPNPQGDDSDGFIYKFYDSQPGTVSIHALSVFTSDLTYTRLSTSKGHYSREINLIMISMQFWTVPGPGWIFLVSTPEIFLSKLELG
jgi:hypothetical protein